MFARVTILLINHVTIFLWEFCTISNTLLLLVHYQMCYGVPYHTFSVKLVHNCIIFSVLSHITMEFLKKEVY